MLHRGGNSGLPFPPPVFGSKGPTSKPTFGRQTGGGEKVVGNTHHPTARLENKVLPVGKKAGCGIEVRTETRSTERLSIPDVTSGKVLQ